MARRIQFIIFIVASFLYQDALYANHYLGGQLTYSAPNVHSNTYKIDLILDRYCSFSSLSNTQNLTILYPVANGYKSVVLIAPRSKTEYLPLACYNSALDCSSSSNRLIERSIYSLDLILDTAYRNRPCHIFFIGNNRSYSDNLVNPNENLGLYLTFIPKFHNTQAKIEEHLLGNLTNQSLNQIRYTSSDLDNDSISILSTRPIIGFNYDLQHNLASFLPNKATLKPGLSDSKPIYINESELIYTPAGVQLTPSVSQISWASIVKYEYRKVNQNGIDTMICISSSNSEKLLQSSSNSSFPILSKIACPHPAIKINSSKVIACGLTNSAMLSYAFLIGKNLSLSRYKIIKNNASDISLGSSINRISGSINDTLYINFPILPTTNDDSSFIDFHFQICEDAISDGYSKIIRSDIISSQSNVFISDTILSCSSQILIPLATKKFVNFSWGQRIISNPNDYLLVNSPKDSWIIATLVDPHPLCPYSDSIFLNQGSIFQIQINTYSPSCLNYTDGRAKVLISGTSSPYIYKWPNNSTQDSIANLGAGSYVVSITDKDGCEQKSTAIIQDPQGIEASFIVDKSINCYDSANGRAHIVISSAIKPNSYQWNHSPRTDSFMDSLRAGIYSGKFYYTNQNNINCHQDFQFLMPQPDSIRMHVVANHNPCFNSSLGKIAIKGQGGNGIYYYILNGNSTTQNLYSNLANGEYTLRIKDINNCSSKEQLVKITSPPKFTFILNHTNPSCQNSNNGSYRLSDLAGGTEPYKMWTNGSEYGSFFSIPDKSIGNYPIRIMDDNLCVFDTFAKLNANYFFHARVDSLILNSCATQNTASFIINNLSGVPPFQYYINQDTIISASPKIKQEHQANGLKHLIVKDANQCEWSTPINITSPDSIRIQKQINHPKCDQEYDGNIQLNITGGIAPYTITCVTQSGNLANKDSLISGEYLVIIRDKNDCLYTDTFSLLPPIKLQGTIELTSPIKCHGDSNAELKAIAYGGNSPYQYFWQNDRSVNQSNFFKSAAGEISVHIIDAYGCKSKVATLLIEPKKLQIDDIKVLSPSCPHQNDGAITIVGSGGTIAPDEAYRYSNDGGTTKGKVNTFKDLGSGSYQVQMIDLNGCKVDSSVLLTDEKELIFKLPEELTIYSGEEIQITPSILYSPFTSKNDITSILWQPSLGLSCIDCHEPTAFPYSSTKYIATLKYGRNCIVEDTVDLIVLNNDNLFIPSAFSPNQDNINDEWKVFGRNISNISIEVFNKTGQLLYESKDAKGGWDGSLHGVIQKPDAYLYHISVSFHSGIQKNYRGMLMLIR